MKLMVDGVWHLDYQNGEKLGATSLPCRADAFKDVIAADGSSGLRAEPGRYHLYVSYACPFAHRTLIYRKLKKLDDVISFSVVHPLWAERGWYFEEGPYSTPDHVNGAGFLHELYAKAKPDYTGKVTVPTLWDKKEGTIVNNESAEIIRMLNSAFDAWGDVGLDLYPEALGAEIDDMSAVIEAEIASGVYRVGFAKSQEAYDAAFDRLFAALDELEARLGKTPFLVGGRLTEADWRLFPTLVRFDSVYYPVFRCNLRRIADYPALSDYLRRLYNIPGVAETVRLDDIKMHYYDGWGWGMVDSRIVPKGPALDLALPEEPGRLVL